MKPETTTMKKEETTNYFIENNKTKQWFVFLMEGPYVHSNIHGQISGDIEPSEFWTNDPQKAWKFNTRDEADKFLNTPSISRRWFEPLEDFEVTKHIFINPSEKKEPGGRYSIEYDEKEHEERYFFRIYAPVVNHGDGTKTSVCIAKVFEESDAIRIVNLLNKLTEGQSEKKEPSIPSYETLEAIAFATWYSGMDRNKVLSAYARYKRENPTSLTGSREFNTPKP